MNPSLILGWKKSLEKDLTSYDIPDTGQLGCAGYRLYCPHCHHLLSLGT